METRARSRRLDPQDTRRTTRSSRQREPPSQDGAHPQAIQTQGSQTAPDSSKRMGLGALPFARRGARATSREASIASIRTVPFKADDETILGEGDDASDVPVHGAFAASIQHGDDQPSQKALTTKLKIIKLSMDDFARSTAQLWHYLNTTNFSDDVSRGFLEVKKRTFDSVRESFTEEPAAPFINWAQIKDIWKSEEETRAGATVIVRANIATALYDVTALLNSMEIRLFPLLDKLNSFFALFFLYPEEIYQHPEVPELLLDIRTWCLIETLEKLPAKSKSDIPRTIASVFCEPSDKDVFKRLAGGPYKGIGAPFDERFDELCSSRITNLVPIINKDRETYGVSALKQEFPLENLLNRLGVWLEAMYRDMDGSIMAKGRQESAPLFNFEEDFEGSQTTASESQPIVRPGTHEENRTSLFVGKESIQYFKIRSRNNPSVPPSNQHQMMPPPEAPRDYLEHTNSELLASPSPSTFSRTIKQKTTAEPAPKRIQQPFIEQEEDDEEDWFETDTRPVVRSKRAPFEASPPPPKRARLEIVTQSSPARSSLHKSTAPPSSRSSEMIRSSQPTRADFDTLRQAKEQVSQQARATLSPFVRQRYSWSHNDMLLLLQLIRDRHAAWANIEKYDNAKFEHPRNQQAFRDKARNMKVDYLMTDAVLPPCFDLVALGKKEVDRLISYGKNPNRKEDDIDQKGRAINTEYIQQ